MLMQHWSCRLRRTVSANAADGSGAQGFTQTGTFSGDDCVDPQLDGKAKGYGYVIDWSLLELRFNQMPQVQELPDLGGGRRFAVDMITGLVCKNPLGLGAFKCA